MHTQLVDSAPGAAVHSGGVAAVLDWVETVGMAEPFSSRGAIVEALKGAGCDASTAMWLGTSTAKAEDGWRFVYDLPAVRAMFDSYGHNDSWPIAHDLAARNAFGLISAGRNATMWSSDETRAHLLQLGAAHVPFPDAGHNVHVDDMKGVVDVLVTAIDEAGVA